MSGPAPLPARFPPERPARRGPLSTISRRFIRQPGIWLAAISLLVSLFWVAAIRPFDAPDEPAHLQAVMQMRTFHILPEVHYDFSRNPKGEVVNTPVDPATVAYIRALGMGGDVRGLPDESFHPPLYHLVVNLLTLPLPSDPRLLLYAARLVSALFGAGTVYFCWAAAREFARAAPLWAIAATGAIVLLPQFCFDRAAVSNDATVDCLAAASFYVWFRGLRDPLYDPRMRRAGLVGGLAILASLSGAALLPGLAVVIACRAFQFRALARPWRARARRAGHMILGAGLSGGAVAGWWPLRNVFVYGEPTGLQNALQFGRLNYPVLDFNSPDTRTHFLNSLWASLWGLFGWMSEHLDDEFYRETSRLAAIALGLSILALLILGVRVLRRQAHVPAYTWQGALAMVAVAVTLGASIVNFNVTVAFQPQGRLLFPLLLPGALLFTGGLYALAPGRLGKVLALSVPLLWLAFMNLAGLARIR